MPGAGISGPCFDLPLSPLLDILGAGSSLFNGFINPQLPMISCIRNGVSGRTADTYGLLMAPTSGMSASQYADTLLLHNKMVELGGGIPLTGGSLLVQPTPGPQLLFADSPMGHMLDYTNFLSGGAAVFPASLNGYINPGVPGVALLGGLTFVGALGLALGGQKLDSTLCSPTHPVDPNQPCAVINTIFGAVSPAFGEALAAMCQALQVMNDFLNQGAAYLQMLTNFLTSILNTLTNAVNALLNKLLEGIRFGLANLLGAMKLDPCMAEVLGAIGTVALQQAVTNSIL